MRKANHIEVADYERRGALYPLGYVSTMAVVGTDKYLRVFVEDLRGSWSRPDPIWEIRAPDGYHFANEMTHGMLEHTLADVREQIDHLELAPCYIDGGCGCEYDA